MSSGSGKSCQTCQTHIKSQGTKKNQRPEVRSGLRSQGTNYICLIICSVSVCPAKCKPVCSPPNSACLGQWIDVGGGMENPSWGDKKLMIKQALLVIYYLPQQPIGYMAINYKPASQIILQILTTKEANGKKPTFVKYALFVRKNKILGFLPSSPAISIRVFSRSNCWRSLILLEHSGHSIFTPLVNK